MVMWHMGLVRPFHMRPLNMGPFHMGALVFSPVDRHRGLSQQIHVPVVHTAEQTPTDDVAQGGGDDTWEESISGHLDERGGGLPFQMYRPTLRSGVCSQIARGM
jgi:hypothetical protein